MAHYQAYRCPECGETFRFLHHPDDCPPPDRCLLCDAWVSTGEPVFTPQAPGIRKSPYAQSIDQYYRHEEEASALRAEEAVGQLERAYRDEEGAAPHEGDRRILDDMQKNQLAELKSGLKVTDMKDPTSMREGDTSYIAPAASQAAANLTIGPSAPGFQNLEGGRPANHAPGVGPQNAGMVISQSLNASHAARAAAMTNAGNMGTYRGT